MLEERSRTEDRERASDNTIGRTLKKHSQAAPEGAVGHSSRRQCRVRGRHGRHTGRLSKAHDPECPWSAWTRLRSNSSLKRVFQSREAGAGRSIRLRIPAHGTAQPVHDVRAVGRLAACQVTDRHTALDYAQVLKELSDTHFPNAKKIVLVQDNLNTHKPASLYEAFSRRGTAARGTVRVALHAQTWELAGYG